MRVTTIGAAVAAIFAASAHAAPSNVNFKAPASGGTLSGVLSDSASCELTGTGISYVRFYLDGQWLNTDTASPYRCNIDTTKYSNATHKLRAIAYDNYNSGTTREISVTISNGGGTAPAATTPPPTGSLSFTSPASGATLKGTANPCAVNGLADTKYVRFYVGSTWLNTDTSKPWACNIDTTKFKDGAHTLKAVAWVTNDTGPSTTVTLPIVIANSGGTTTPPPPPPPDDEAAPPTSSLPSTNTRAVATFESLGLYWKPPSNPGTAGCSIRYKKASESTWKEGLPMWYDSRNSECRGSLVHLAPGTDYQVQFALPGKTPMAQVNTKTWSENFPIAKTVTVGNRTTQLNITEGGSPNGYVLYTGGSIDVNNAADANIKISAPYVIVRGLTLKGAKIDAIQLVQGAHDVVIEDNDISNWGRWSGTTTKEGWKVAVNKDSAVKAYCSSGPWLTRTIIQRNKMHHPRYGSNSWSEGHPMGSNAIYLYECGGNHVWRYNEVYSETGRYFMDGFGGADNFSNRGFPNEDSDIYGNRIQHVWDDAIEAEGANRNVRIWANYMDQTATAVATTSTSAGPVYVFRNVWNRSRHYSDRSLDSDSRLYMFKSGSQSGYGKGRRYMFHNTMLQATQSGLQYPLGGGSGLAGPNSTQILENTVSRNNVYHVWKPHWASIDTKGGSGNDLDYDLRNGTVSGITGAELRGIVGTPVYAPGHGWQSEAGGNYSLAPSSPGYDRGQRLPNFNDGFTGAGPDMGAHEAGKPPMKFGR